MANLNEASREWATRPADERYFSVREAYDVATAERQMSAEGKCKAKELFVTADDNGDLILVGPRAQAKLNHWSFSQLCIRANGAPRDYIADLPTELAARNLNYGLRASGDGENDVNVLVTEREDEHSNLEARAILSGRYNRLWDSIFLESFLALEKSRGWRIPPARPAGPLTGRTWIATSADVLRGKEGGGGLSINVGDTIAPAGMYRGKQDMFVFMIDDNHVIEAGNEKLARGFFFWNSEVGARSRGWKTFYYRNVCGNHIVWGAENVSENRHAHTGRETEGQVMRSLTHDVARYLESGTYDVTEKIRRAQRYLLGDTKDEVMTFVTEKKALLIPAKTAALAYATVEMHPEDGDPRTAWGFAQGLTRLSQLESNQDRRGALDKKAGRILEFAF